LWNLTGCKYNALVSVWEDEQYRQDLRSALIRLDLRNAWFVGESHPEPWQLDELLTPRLAREESGGNSPEREIWFQQLKIKSAMAVKAGTWGGEEVYPLPD